MDFKQGMGSYNTELFIGFMEMKGSIPVYTPSSGNGKKAV
jgi:hypothetical protein